MCDSEYSAYASSKSFVVFELFCFFIFCASGAMLWRLRRTNEIHARQRYERLKRYEVGSPTGVAVNMGASASNAP